MEGEEGGLEDNGVDRAQGQVEERNSPVESTEDAGGDGARGRRMGKGKRQHDAEEEVQQKHGKKMRTRVSMERIYKLRAFVRTKFHPISDRFLRSSLCNGADAEELRNGMRLTAKLYAEVPALAGDALEEYEAKGYLECNGDGTIREIRDCKTLIISEDSTSSPVFSDSEMDQEFEAEDSGPGTITSFNNGGGNP